MKNELLEYSFKNNLAHIPSALSMIDYLQEIFKYINIKDDIIILGKPFGAQAYYLIWKKLGWIDDIESLSLGVKHDEIDFIHYSEETIGNALGVASGVALTTEKLVYVNISDAALQMGNTLEAIQFIGQQNLKNILITVDYNGSQVTGNTKDIINISPIIDMFKGYNFHVQVVDENFKESLYNLDSKRPKVIFFKTKKGNGYKTLENDIRKWHYKKIESLDELNMLCKELNEKDFK